MAHGQVLPLAIMVHIILEAEAAIGIHIVVEDMAAEDHQAAQEATAEPPAASMHPRVHASWMCTASSSTTKLRNNRSSSTMALKEVLTGE